MLNIGGFLFMNFDGVNMFLSSLSTSFLSDINEMNC